MDSIKTYLVEVVLKKLTSQAVQQAIVAATVFMAAHQNALTQFGITTFTWGTWPFPAQPSGLCTLIEWDTLGVGGAAGMFTVTGILWAWFQHHGVATVTGKPQSGDKRDPLSPPVLNGDRKEDPGEPPSGQI